MNRAIKQVGETVLYQLLYTGAQWEVFLFFMDPDTKGKKNLNLGIIETDI